MLLINIPSRSINLQAALRYPLIKFRYGTSREQHQKPESAAAATASSAKSAAQATQIAEPIFDFQLPLRFRRKPLSEEEIDLINRGGPA